IAIRTTLGAPELVSVDPNQLSQVLLNLVANARDAMPEGGALAVETSCAVLPRELGEPRLHTRIRVRDSGHGMDETTRSRIFEPFFTTKGNRGTGLGLATAFGTIRQSGGHITVDSAPGRGATFDLYLPLVDVSLPPDAPSSRVPVAGARADARRILVVDDDTGVRKMIVRALQNAGYET
ncbi:MAG: hybrid sensor histidine kinase/response regulator, partial [Myxococcales bacterium]|nr:hybrid sensor histidine kinase/response regulator [Myxococcales bacterium]